MNPSNRKAAKNVDSIINNGLIQLGFHNFHSGIDPVAIAQKYERNVPINRLYIPLLTRTYVACGFVV